MPRPRTGACVLDQELVAHRHSSSGAMVGSRGVVLAVTGVLAALLVVLRPSSPRDSRFLAPHEHLVLREASLRGGGAITDALARHRRWLGRRIYDEQAIAAAWIGRCTNFRPQEMRSDTQGGAWTFLALDALYGPGLSALDSATTMFLSFGLGGYVGFEEFLARNVIGESHPLPKAKLYAADPIAGAVQQARNTVPGSSSEFAHAMLGVIPGTGEIVHSCTR